MKKIILLLTSLLSISSFANGVVNVYSARHYKDVDKKIYEAFEKETGIKVNVITEVKDAAPVIKRMKDEGKNTQADVFLGVGVGSLYQAKKAGVLQVINDKKILENVPVTFRDHQNYWVAMTYRARVFVYNPDKIKTSQMSTYLQLADPIWKGKIVTRSSKSEYNKNLIAFMIAKYGYDKTLAWAKGLVSNFARDPEGNDRAQAAFVEQNLGADLAIMNTYYMGKMLSDKDPIKVKAAHHLKIFFPDQKDGGAHINISGAGIAKYAKHKEAAVKLIEFLTGPVAQEILTDANFEYPVNKNVPLNPVVKSFGTFIPSKITFDQIGQNLDLAVKLAGEAGWK